MSKISYDLTKIKAVAFDVDGVLSPSTINLGADGMPVRMVNIKDGYAMQLAVKCGIKIAIITGADSQAIIDRYRSLGITDIFTKTALKLPCLKAWAEQQNLRREEIAFVGDDVPDYEAMTYAGLSVAPADACTDIKQTALYISPVDGGYGVARDLLEEILRAKGEWMMGAKAFGW